MLSSDTDHKLPKLFLYEESINSHSSFLPQCFPAFFRCVEKKLENTLKRCPVKSCPQRKITVNIRYIFFRCSGKMAIWIDGSLSFHWSVCPSTRLSLSMFPNDKTHTQMHTHTHVHVYICTNDSILLIQFYRLFKPKNILLFIHSFYLIIQQIF